LQSRKGRRGSTAEGRFGSGKKGEALYIIFSVKSFGENDMSAKEIGMTHKGQISQGFLRGLKEQLTRDLGHTPSNSELNSAVSSAMAAKSKAAQTAPSVRHLPRR
jgi:hypothetical protein